MKWVQITNGGVNLRDLERYIKERNEQLKKDKKSFEQEQKRLERREKFEKTLVTILKPYNDLKNSIKAKQEEKQREANFQAQARKRYENFLALDNPEKEGTKENIIKGNGKTEILYTENGPIVHNFVTSVEDVRTTNVVNIYECFSKDNPEDEFSPMNYTCFYEKYKQRSYYLSPTKIETAGYFLGNHGKFIKVIGKDALQGYKALEENFRDKQGDVEEHFLEPEFSSTIELGFDI